ncbi:MAG: cytochrome c-type biogenesis protein [Gammaproteobacteria bacterium]|nr:cytochrome c-type biogenesis protein [Gammaproteobacteria bacterium]
MDQEVRTPVEGVAVLKGSLGLLICLLWLAPEWGMASVPAAPNADDPALEARLNRLAEGLRCVVCQNESLAESRASLALDLREEIREMMRAGMSDDAVVESLVARYGDFVLYRPPLKPLTYLLWAGPLAFLLGGAGLAMGSVLRRRMLRPQADVSADALREAARLLQGSEPHSPRGTDAVSGPTHREER